MPRKSAVPSYRLHKPSGQAVVTIRTPDGGERDVYLGKHNSPESRAEYARVVAGIGSAPTPVDRRPPASVTVAEVCVAFLTHADGHYRRADGTPTVEPREFKLTIRVVRDAGLLDLPAAEFGPKKLRFVRDEMIRKGWCRRLVNQRTDRLKRVFKWAAAEELVPGSVYEGLRCLPGLQAGRSPAPESAPVGPVDADVVERTLGFLPPTVAGMVRFQSLTGCRPGEVCLIRPCDLDTTADVWEYRPRHHKLAHRNKPRVIFVGPLAQALLNEFWPAAGGDHFFSPVRAVAEFHAARSAARVTPRFASHVARNAAKRTATPRRPPAACYTTMTYGKAIARGVKKANADRTAHLAECGPNLAELPRWAPNQLRHSHGTTVRQDYGLEAAQVALGHAHANVTQVYAERNMELAARVAREIG